ncbi:MAG TPA: hypothetical protein VFO98_09350 [Marmoricola sp.]|jgi:hypothetical protein|nr:hypothetical protein [Marmoricola sp.]
MKDRIHDALRALREAVEQARSMPMSASVMVNRAELLDLVGNLEQAIESALHEADTVLGDRSAVVARGQDEADEIVRRAHAERDKLVSDTDVYRLGTERAEEITAAAEREAAALRAETEQYVEGQLANFELTLERTIEAVRRGRSRLSTSGLGDDDDDSVQLPRHLTD